MIPKRPSLARPTRHAVGFYASLLLLVLAVTLFVMSPDVRAVPSISESYTSTEPLSFGSIVSLKNNTTDQVVAATTSNANNILGVVINENTSLLSISNGQDNQTQVTTSGTVQVLVSNINGSIERGDHITASPISGVGMKATGNVRIVGIAQGELGTRGTKQTYKDKAGKEQTVLLGEVPVLVNVSYFFKEPDKTIVPSVIQNIANSLAGKTVSTLPIIISAAIFLVMTIVVVSIIYAMIRSSIISVGRNPMSQSAIYRDLIQLSALVIAILAVSLIAMYLILTRL